MDAFFDGLDCRLRVSGMVADSIMMGIVNSAMEDAYKKSCSKEGDLERLNEKSRFCELAIMQLEWCLKYFQEETESHNILEGTHDRQKLLSELLETRDRIHHRLEETELAITEKDRELSQLRLALEVKDDDIISLHSAIRLEKVKGERVNKFAFQELVNTIDEQMSEVRRKLENGRRCLMNLIQSINVSSSDTRDLGSGFAVAEDICSDGDETVHRVSESNILNCDLIAQLKKELKEMAAGVEIIKEKVDASLETMEGSISLLKSALDEERWIWNVEEDIINVIIRSFLRDMQCNFDVGLGIPRENVPPLLLDINWPAFMDDITSLHNELEMLASQMDEECSDSSSKVGKLGNAKGLSKENSSGYFVAEMIRNHESIIQKKTQEIDWPKGQLHSEKIFSNSSNDRNLDSAKEMIARVIARLDGVMEKKVGPFTACDNRKAYETDLTRFKLMEDDQTLIVAPGQTCKNMCCDQTGNELRRDIGLLKQETDDLETKAMILEDIYAILFKCLTRRLHLGSIDYDMETSIREDTFRVTFSEMVKEWINEGIAYNIERLLMEEIYLIAFTELGDDSKKALNSTTVRRLDEDVAFANILWEDTCTVIFSEMVKEWNNERENCNIEKLLMEDIFFIVLTELVKDTKGALNSTSFSCQKEDLWVDNNLKEDMDGVLISERAKEWHNEKESYNIERLLMEDIYCIVFIEVVKDMENTVNIVSMRGKEDDIPSGINQGQCSGISGGMDHMQEMDSLSNHFDAPEDLDFNFDSELMESHSHLDLIGSELDRSIEEHIQHGRLLVEKDGAYNFLTGKFRKALQQTRTSEMQLKESMSSLELPNNENDLEHDSVTSNCSIMQGGTLSLCLPSKYEEKYSNELNLVLMHLTKFSQAIMDFEHVAHSKIIANISRYCKCYDYESNTTSGLLGLKLLL